MTSCLPLAVIGAGPYGMSIAAHLRSAGRPFRIFGRPMETWRTHMPAGMSLKSEGFASGLYDPAGAYPLSVHCRANGLPYGDVGVPVPLATFAAYGREFQRRFVPDLEPEEVAHLARSTAGFRISLHTGETFESARVIVATGLTAYHHVPVPLRGLPGSLVSHSSEHGGLDRFAGQDVTVVGGGASALDILSLLTTRRARARLVTRRGTLHFPPAPAEPRSLRQRVRAPRSRLGTGWKSWFYSREPLMFHRLPSRIRHDIVRRHLGPMPCWFVRDQVVGNAEMLLGHAVEHAAPTGERIRLRLAGRGGQRTIETDHVIAATGFRIDLHRLPFLAAELRQAIACQEGAPVLSDDFQSSVPGLSFVGAAAAPSFGPLLRFACGAEFAARRLARVEEARKETA